MEEIIINGEKVFLKKSFLGWGVIHPPKINDKIQWVNLIAGGSWWNLWIVLIFCIILVGAIVEYSNVITVANECLQNSSGGIKLVLP